jgi:hypothetical protein
MTKTYILGLLAALGTAVFVLEMLRRGILREKYAALWLFVSATLLVFAAFPAVLRSLADAAGIQLPSNLLFLMAAVLLLLVSVQLSYEVSRLEARSRRLAEEVALLRHDVALLRKDQADG